MDATELSEALDGIMSDSQKLLAKREALKATIQPQLDVLNLELRAAEEVALANKKELLKSVTYETLTDPLGYGEFSRLAWGVGESALAPQLKAIFPETYVMYAHSGFYGYNMPLFSPKVAIPKLRDEGKLARTAELLGPVLKAATAFDETARISIFEDSLSYSMSYEITWDEEDEVFELSDNYRTSGDLLTVLKAAPTYM